VFKKITKKFTREKEFSVLSLLVCSMSAASISSFVTNPIDVVKLNFQVASKLDKNTNTAAKLALNLAKNHGIKIFFRGAGARIIWIAPRTAFSWTVYEKCLHLFSNKMG